MFHYPRQTADRKVLGARAKKKKLLQAVQIIWTLSLAGAWLISLIWSFPGWKPYIAVGFLGPFVLAILQLSALFREGMSDDDDINHYFQS